MKKIKIMRYFELIIIIIIIICFLGPHLWHMEIPSLGVKSELQLSAYTTATATRDPTLSVTYTTAPGNAGSLTHLLRPGIELSSLWIQV